jgi:hypothetical protein
MNEKKTKNSKVLKEKSDASKNPGAKVARTQTVYENTEKDHSEQVSQFFIFIISILTNL